VNPAFALQRDAADAEASMSSPQAVVKA